MTQQLAAQSMKKGSKSFRMASLLLPKDKRLAAQDLYSWCRYCDDAIDAAPNVETARLRLEELKQMTAQAYEYADNGNWVFDAFHRVMTAHKIPLVYALDLLRGMEMDVRNERYTTLRDLEQYCYCVAGTVGLMMAHVLGVTDKRALTHACALGIGMQFTNICRDVREDWERGRCYIPTSFFGSKGEKEFFLEENRVELFRVVTELLRHAQIFYRQGFQGAVYLTLGCALGIHAAGRIYSSIGNRILKLGLNWWGRRAIVSLPYKMLCVVRALFSVALLGVSTSLRRPRQQLKSLTIWEGRAQ